MPGTVTHHIRVWLTNEIFKDYETTNMIVVDDVDRIVFTTNDGHKHDISKKNKFDVETWDTVAP